MREATVGQLAFDQCAEGILIHGQTVRTIEWGQVLDLGPIRLADGRSTFSTTGGETRTKVQ
jgi:hypothetical protein